MREILFRGKRMDNGDWATGYLEYFYSKDGKRKLHCYISIWGKEMHKVAPSTVGQFTGLLDKNGKRIFEGDVVLKRTYHGKKAFPVEFGGGMFYCGFGGGSSTATHRYTLEDKQIEVIGNIHDNPDLLEVTSDE